MAPNLPLTCFHPCPFFYALIFGSLILSQFFRSIINWCISVFVFRTASVYTSCNYKNVFRRRSLHNFGSWWLALLDSFFFFSREGLSYINYFHWRLTILDEGMRLCLVPSPWNSDKDQKKNEENPFSFTLFREGNVVRAGTLVLHGSRAVVENTTHNRNGFHSSLFIQLQHSSLQKNAKQTQISTTNRPPSPKSLLTRRPIGEVQHISS